NDSSGYIETFNRVYGKLLGCRIDTLQLVRESPSPTAIRNKILAADIIYVGGGNTLSMLKVWRNHDLDNLLRHAYESGTVLAGLSAGAICWFRYGCSDAKRFWHPPSNDLLRIKGLGILEGTASPHHIREKHRTPGLKKMMIRTPGIGFAMDDYTALEIVDDEFRVLRTKKQARVHKIYSDKGGTHHVEVPVIKGFSPLVDLYKKEP
ncbi:MAG: Type 1 glutamine amidotransferase-like domain-containing protein, partial [Nanoarchaeota archaeon]